MNKLESLSKSDLYEMKNKIEDLLLSEDVKNDLEVNVFVKNSKRMKNKNWMFLFQDTEFLLARTLSSAACRVVMLFRAVCKYENRVEYSQKQIHKILGISRQSISKAISELKEKGIVVEFRDDLDERRKVYYLNPESQWKGKAAKMTGIQAIFNEDGNFEDFKNQNQSDPNQLDLVEESIKATAILKEINKDFDEEGPYEHLED